jgi:alpha-glucosidase
MATPAHETALYVVFESPFQMLSDYPEAYEDQKELDFLRKVPTTWDETRVLGGDPSRYIAIARRSGQDWYIGSITGWDSREIEIPLSFLGRGSYSAEIYADAPDAATQPKNTVREQQTVTAQTVLKAKLAPGGGYAVRLTPAR